MFKHTPVLVLAAFIFFATFYNQSLARAEEPLDFDYPAVKAALSKEDSNMLLRMMNIHQLDALNTIAPNQVSVLLQDIVAIAANSAFFQAGGVAKQQVAHRLVLLADHICTAMIAETQDKQPDKRTIFEQFKIFRTYRCTLSSKKDFDFVMEGLDAYTDLATQTSTAGEDTEEIALRSIVAKDHPEQTSLRLGQTLRTQYAYRCFFPEE